MKTVSLTPIVFMLCLITCFGQDKEKECTEILSHFVSDLQRDISNADLFRKYLRSGGVFDSEQLAQTANGWTDVVRISLKGLIAEDVVVYKYSDRPEKGRKTKSVEDPDSHVVEYVPLEFELRTKNNTVSNVNLDDLYVIGIRDEKVFVLFGPRNKVITYFGLKWGQKIELTEF